MKTATKIEKYQAISISKIKTLLKQKEVMNKLEKQGYAKKDMEHAPNKFNLERDTCIRNCEK